MVEQSAFNRLVPGSNPGTPTKFELSMAKKNKVRSVKIEKRTEKCPKENNANPGAPISQQKS